MNNRDKALQLLDAIDALQVKAEEQGYLMPGEVAQVNTTITHLVARAQIHAILALTDPKDEL